MKIIDNFSLKKLISQQLSKISRVELKELLGLERYKCEEMSLTLDEILFSIIEFKYIGNVCLKSFWHMKSSSFVDSIYAKGRTFPTYQIYHKWYCRCGELLAYLLDLTLKPLNQGLGFIDSAKMPIGEPYRFIKSMGKGAGVGHSSTGKFYGLKLHTLIDDKGNLCNYQITSGNIHDLTPVKNGFLDGQTGRIHGDKGYISREVYFDLMEQNLMFLAKPRENMTYGSDWSFEYCIEWEKKHKKEYRKRLSIERYFAHLKRGYNLCIKGLRSLKMAKAYIYSSLLACQMEIQGLIKIEKII